MEMSMPNTVSYKVGEGLFLVRQGVSKSAPAKAVETPTNHILIVDVSGSMYGEIDKIRDQIKTKLPKLMKEADTLSLIAFSGRGQFWRILTAEPIRTLTDLTEVNKAIDRWLRPQGATGFKDPIEDAGKLIEEISKKNKNPFSLFFLSDGWDNCSNRADIIKAVEKTSGGLSAATVVSYGHYADLQLLTAMAEKWGGNLIVSDNFTKFSPVLDAVIQKRVVGGKKVEVKVRGDLIGGFAFQLDDKELVTFSVEGEKLLVPESATEVFYLSPTKVGSDSPSLEEMAGNIGGDFDGIVEAEDRPALAAAYAAVSLFAVRMKPDVVLPLLKALGDVTYIEKFSTLFGKQKYSEYQDETKTAAFDETKRWTKGFDPKRVPRDDAYTLLQLLKLLQTDDENRVLLTNPAFKYNRIGRGRVDSNTKLTDAEQAELDALTTELSTVKKDLAKTKEISAKIAALTNKPEPLKFVEDKDGGEMGYSVSNLVFNEDRPNVSILVRKEGTVDLSSRLPDEFKGKGLGKIPEHFSSFVFRNYTIVKDGLVNVSALPVRLSRETANELKTQLPEGALSDLQGRQNHGEYLIDLTKLPVINRQMVKDASARTLFEKHWELTKARAAQKVYNSYMKEKFPGKKSEGFSALYGEEGSKWLAEQGITDYSGFGPKMVQTEASDVYMAKTLEVKLKGYSTIPSLNEFKKQAAKGKFNGPAELMKPAVDEVEAFLASDVYNGAADKDSLLQTWLGDKAKDVTSKVRRLLFDVAQIKFTVIIGGIWFTEFKSLDETSMDLTVDGVKATFTAELKEVEEKI